MASPLQPVPKRQRRRIRRQAERVAHAQYDPLIAQLKGQKRRVRRQYRRDLAANQAYVQQAADIVGDTSLRGLQGPYRQMTKAGMARMEAGAALQLPALNMASRATRAEAMAGINDELAGARVDLAQEAATEYASRLAKQQTFLESKEGAGGGKRGRTDWQKEIANAKERFRNIWSQIPVGLRPGEPGAIDMIRKNYDAPDMKEGEVADLHWENLIDTLLKSEGVSNAKVARSVVEQWRRRGMYQPQNIPGYQGPQAYSMYDRRRR